MARGRVTRCALAQSGLYRWAPAENEPDRRELRNLKIDPRSLPESAPWRRFARPALHAARKDAVRHILTVRDLSPSPVMTIMAIRNPVRSLRHQTFDPPPRNSPLGE